jgi:hypothetical protein
LKAVRHHYVPQGFLRGFAIDGEPSRSFVWVYDKGQSRTPRKKSVRSIAWAPAYYAQEREDGTTDLDTLETSLATTIDNRIPVILQNIRPHVGRKVEVSDDDKGALAFFLGLSLTRVPSFRDGMNDFHSQVAKVTLSQLMDQDPELATAAERYGIRAEAKPWVSLRPMVQLAEAIATSVLKKNWQFFIAPPSVPLVTSDNPVVFAGKASGLTQFGPAHPGVELVMNLRKDLAVVCTPKRGYESMRVFALTPSEARKFNRGIVRAARQRVFASHFSNELDRFVKKHADHEQRVIV